MNELEKTQAYLKMNKKERQALMIQEWYLDNHITIIEKQNLEFMNQHTNVRIDTDVVAQSDEVKCLKLKAVDYATFRTVFEKVIVKERG